MLATAFHYRPFITALPIWDYWFWLLLPLSFGVALAYKSIKCASPDTIVREAIATSIYIVLGMVGAAIGLYVLVGYMNS